jgi:hypothetical protein
MSFDDDPFANLNGVVLTDLVARVTCNALGDLDFGKR